MLFSSELHGSKFSYRRYVEHTFLLFLSELHVTKFSYRRYVEHTFLLFSSELHVTKFLNYVNSKHRNIKVTVEREENNSLSLLNINIFRHSGKFQTSVYRKPTFRDVLTNIDNFLPILYKYNLVCTLLQRQGRIYWGGGSGARDFPNKFSDFCFGKCNKTCSVLHLCCHLHLPRQLIMVDLWAPTWLHFCSPWFSLWFWSEK